MNIRRRHRVQNAVRCVGIFLLLSRATDFAEHGPKQAVSEHRITFTGEGPTVGTIRMTMEFYGMGQLRSPARVREWGSGLPIDRAIRKIQLAVNGTRIEVPAKAYANLFNIIPSTIAFREKGRVLSLYMKGGDGAQAYETRIKIVGGAPKERETVGGEFKCPESPYERITFKPDGTTSYWLTKNVPKDILKPVSTTINLKRK